MDQTTLRSEFKNAPSKAIILHIVTAKVGTSNRVTASCSCKKTCSSKSQCKCQKQKLKCTQYRHSSAGDCGNIGTIEGKTETAVVDRPANNSDSDSSPLLPSHSDNDHLLPEELQHSPLLPPDEQRPKQQRLAPTSDVHFSNQRHGRKPSTKKPCANTNSHQKQNKINTEA